MKKIITLIITISIILFASIKSVNAEEVEVDSTSSTTEMTNDNASDLEKWVEENLPWLVGIPTGMLTTLLSIALFVFKAKKAVDSVNGDTKENNAQGRVILEHATTILSDTKTLAKSLEVGILNALDNIEKTDTKVNERMSKLTVTLTTGLELLNKNIALLENRIKHLEDAQEMIALHTKELVANGTAEKITKKIRG